MYNTFKLSPTTCFKIQFRSLPIWINKMMSRLNIVKLENKENEAIIAATQVLKKGGIIALPTDTLYGFAVDATNSRAIKSLYQVKQRDFKKPFAICVDKVSEITKWGVIDNLPIGLLNKLLPGPVTVLLNRTPALNEDLNPGVMLVGIRVVPEYNDKSFICKVAADLGKPLALTSANTSNEPSCIDVNEFKVLWPLIEMIFDDGTIDNPTREGSTVVDLSIKGKYKIVRPGKGLKSVIHLLHNYNLTQLL